MSCSILNMEDGGETSLNKSICSAFAGILIFAVLIGLAFRYQSAYFLYAASIVPLVTVPFLPDIRTAQYLRAGKRSPSLRFYRTGEAAGTDPGLIIVEFAPGDILWNKHTVYFSLQDIAEARADSAEKKVAATLSVLKYDLVRHRRRKGWVGVRLAPLKERTAGLSFTLREVNRLAIRIEDIRELARPKTPAVRERKGTTIGA